MLARSAWATLGLTFSRLPAMAGPFTREEFEQLVPADKKLAADWVDSLFARGEPEVLHGDELKYVGMPVGGIGCGQLYLAGDGRLLHWDIFNRHVRTGSEHYAKPFEPQAPLKQTFALRIGDKSHALDRTGFPQVSFRGGYPVGTVDYSDPAVPLTVRLEAFSPFIPLQADDSSHPATILQFTVSNPSPVPVEAVLVGDLENGVCLDSRGRNGLLRNRTVRGSGYTAVFCSAEDNPQPRPARPDILFEDWNKDSYEGWQVEGTAFGSGPIRKTAIPAYQGDVGGDTERVANSHATAPGDSVGSKDNATGRLLSREFVVERDFISFWIGGGKSREGKRLGLTLFVEGKAVASASGQDRNEMAPGHFDVRAHAGKMARLELIDEGKGGWGNTGLGRITFTDQAGSAGPLEELPDFGTMALALLGDPADGASADGTAPFGAPLAGSLERKLVLAPGATARIDFVLAWHFPNLTMAAPLGKTGRHYAARFPSALAVVESIASRFDELAEGTRLWRDTWSDSTLPYWFLDRTFLNTSILATSTSYRFQDGRFWGWEGVGCCQGTCGHVYHYAHAAGRLFPELERITRERVDFGLALQPDGAIHFRGEFNKIPAVDGQAGTILRALREHQMSPDGEFLRRNWPQIKLATQWLLAKDGDGDGIIEGNQHNTLDADWYGPVAWLSGLYLAALLAAAEMAGEAGDPDFARQCREIVENGRKNLVSRLFDGEYFINEVDPNHPESINSGTGCEIDQVFGQSWAFQVGLPRVLPEKETRSALQALWRYNFSPDVGPWREANKPGRWYAMPGEAGLLMCTFPRGDWDFERAAGRGNRGFAGYFNECMNGFEYQVAGHLIWEGMVLEGLAVTRAVHDRYHGSRRNPWNEVECGDHYARSMASYGVYLAACGFEYHGPKQHIGFAPKISPERFRCAFTSAEGWGSYAQRVEGGELKAEVAVRRGRMKLRTISLEAARGTAVRASLASRPVPASLSREGGRVRIRFEQPVEVDAGQRLEVVVGI